MQDAIPTLPEEDFSPGVEGTFALPDTVYHDPEKAPGVSRTVIVELLQKSASHAQTLIEGTHAKTLTKAMVGGTLFDRALLEPELFIEGVTHWVIPASIDKLTTSEGRAWRKEHPDLPAIPVDSDVGTVVSLNDIKGMKASVMAHPIGRVIVEQGTKQESAFCKDLNTGLMRKVRPDARIYDADTKIVLADVKCTFRGGASGAAWAKHCARMAYYIQDPYYSDVYADLYEKPYFLFLVVERKPPYAVSVFQIDEEGRQAGRRRYRLALEQIRRCQETGVWPGYDQKIRLISLPRWELAAPEPEL